MTHRLTYLDVCDQVVFLAPGGKTAYSGPASAIGAAMGTTDWADLFARVAADPDTAPGRVNAEICCFGRFGSCRGHFLFPQFSEGFHACPTINRPDCRSVPGRWANDTKWRSLVAGGPSRGGIEAYCDIVKVGREEPCKVIESRRSRLMAN